MNADGGGERRLTERRETPSTPAGLFFQIEPAWSPDGTKIAFASRRRGTFDIYVMNADGTGTRAADLDEGERHPSDVVAGRTGSRSPAARTSTS